MAEKTRLLAVIATGTGLVVACAALAMTLLPNPCDVARSPLARDVAVSLRDHPDDWNSDSYYLRHRNGLTFWVANHAGTVAPEGPRDSDEWEITDGGSLFASDSQRCVMKSYLAWREPRQHEPRLTP